MIEISSYFMMISPIGFYALLRVRIYGIEWAEYYLFLDVDLIIILISISVQQIIPSGVSAS